MECHRSGTHNQVANIGQDEDRLLRVHDAISNSLEAEPHKHNVSRRVDQLGAVHGNVVVLVANS